MKKAFVNFVYLASITFSIVSIREAFADRGPSVEPMAEVDIENNKAVTKNSGFNFASSEKKSVRTPAGIVAKDSSNTKSPYSYIGPLIFLLALPFAIWMLISRKLNSEVKTEEKIDYYPKTFQFKPFKTEYHKSDDDHDDMDYPKAS